jgi:hypothetical protein
MRTSRARVLLIAGLGVLLGVLLGLLGAGLWLQPAAPDRGGVAPLAAGNKAEVLVVNRPLAAGSPLPERVLRTVALPSALMLGDCVAAEQARFAVDLPLARSLRQGDLLRWSDLDPAALRAALADPGRAETRSVYEVFLGEKRPLPLPLGSYNTAHREDRHYMGCLVFLAGPAVVLERIDCVAYRYPPSFPEAFRRSQRRVCAGQAGPNFSSRFSATGTFGLPVRVRFKDGTELEWIHPVHF